MRIRRTTYQGAYLGAIRAGYLYGTRTDRSCVQHSLSLLRCEQSAKRTILPDLRDSAPENIRSGRSMAVAAALSTAGAKSLCKFQCL